MDPYVEWICRDCAEAIGAHMANGHRATFHCGNCDVCGKIKPITEPRDYILNREGPVSITKTVGKYNLEEANESSLD